MTRWSVLKVALIAAAVSSSTGCALQTADPDDEEAVAQREDGVETSPFKVMSYNLRYQADEDTGARRWVERRESVFERILLNHPDILGVQEAKRPSGGYDYPAELELVLTGFTRPYATFDPGGGSPKLIFWKKSRFELAEPGTTANVIKLPNPYSGGSCASKASGRTATWLKLRDKVTQKVYFVVNAHLAHSSCSLAREKSAVTIKQTISALADGMPVIVMGDLNVDTHAAGAPYEDTVHTLQWRGRDMKYANAYSGTTTASKATFNDGWGGSAADTRRLDYVFFSGSLEATSYTIDRTKNDDGISPSDHYPIVVTLGPS